MTGSTNGLALAGDISLFGLRAVTDAFRRPFEVAQIRRQIAEVGSKSLPLIVASGFALGAVLTLHTRGTLVTFGATAWIPTVQALAFFVEIGPLVTGLLVAGRVGSGIGAVLSNMRATTNRCDRITVGRLVQISGRAPHRRVRARAPASDAVL